MQIPSMYIQHVFSALGKFNRWLETVPIAVNWREQANALIDREADVLSANRKLPSRRWGRGSSFRLAGNTGAAAILYSCRMPRFKVLKGVAHNIGHSFTSLMNYSIDDYSM